MGLDSPKKTFLRISAIPATGLKVEKIASPTQLALSPTLITVAAFPMKLIATLLIACGLASLALAAPAKVTEISHDQLKAAIASKSVTILDVNGTESFQEGRIPGAIDFIANEKKIAAMLPKQKDALIVAYCGNEYCPAYKAAATVAVNLGYTNVKHYAPGIDGWKKSGAKVEKS
jgi:rhodanese-related sulfurtransferase